LIAAGTSFSTVGSAAGVGTAALGVPAEVELELELDDELLLPQAAIATTQSAANGAANQLLHVRRI
jgi:hypothetical protein